MSCGTDRLPGTTGLLHMYVMKSITVTLYIFKEYYKLKDLKKTLSRPETGLQLNGKNALLLILTRSKVIFPDIKIFSSEIEMWKKLFLHLLY